jgi:cadmium resistance protein CadD (predicted permease)
MSAFAQAIFEASSAFSATNIDDLLILTLCFSSADLRRQPWHVVCGQFLGIGALVAVSLLSLLGRAALPQGWIGLLGLFPISLGLSQLADSFHRPPANAEDAVQGDPVQGGAGLSGGVLAGTLAVASLTIANGSDNISVYMALFAHSDPPRLAVILAMFALLTGFWCLLAWWLTQSPGLAQPLARFGREFAPLLLLGIGALVLHDSRVLLDPPLALLVLACLGAMVGSLLWQLRGMLAERRLSELSPP